MPEEVKTANTSITENNTEMQDGNADTVNQNLNNSESATETPESNKSEEVVKKEKQSKEQNSEYARRRREAEHQKAINKAKEEARIEATIKVLGGKNPYTGEQIKDSADVEEYFLMQEIKESGGDPITDYHKHYKERLKQKEQRAVASKQKDEWFENDRIAFEQKHPEVNLEELISNEKFQIFTKGKVGEMPLSEIYEDFLSFESDSDTKAKKMAIQIVANKNASVGSVTGNSGSQNNDFFSKEEVKKMSKSEIDKNYEKIKQSMKKWK